MAHSASEVTQQVAFLRVLGVFCVVFVLVLGLFGGLLACNL